MKQSGELNRRKDITVNKDQPSAASLDTLDSLVGCPHVDHNHKTGAVRALLCNRCNSVIGLTGESVTILKAMEEYLCHGYSAKR